MESSVFSFPFLSRVLSYSQLVPFSPSTSTTAIAVELVVHSDLDLVLFLPFCHTPFLLRTAFSFSRPSLNYSGQRKRDGTAPKPLACDLQSGGGAVTVTLIFQSRFLSGLFHSLFGTFMHKR